MPNIELHNELKQLSGYVYNNNEFKKPQGWIEIEKDEGKITGFYAETFIKGNNVAIAFRGTDFNGKYNFSKKDLISDIMMGTSILPTQIISAQNYYDKIKKEFPNYNVILTGHSLGGSLAQILGAEYGNKTITFNAYGTANLLKYQIKNSDNITNYGNVQDPFFIANIQNQIGKTLVTGNFNGNEYGVVNKPSLNISYSIDKHLVENMGDLSTAIPYRGQNLQTEETLLLKASVEKNINLRDFDTNRIITNEEISEMTQEEFHKNEDFINQQIKNGKIMTKAQADTQVKACNLIWVNSYTRDDGTEVKGYYRSKPSEG